MSISIKNISKTFVLKDRTVEAVRDISLEIQNGDFITVVGKSGCGKSTFLQILGGLLKPDTGEVRYDRDGMRCGFVFQEPRLLKSNTVRENLLLGMKHIKSNMEKMNILSEVLDMLELTEFMNAYPHQLSGGMAQRVALGRALCRQPDILLMDEPFSALDAFLRKKLQEELVNLYTGKKLTIIFVTHDVSEAVYIGKKVLVMSSGEIIKEFSVSLDYPKNRSSMDFIHLCDSILETIGSSRYQV